VIPMSVWLLALLEVYAAPPAKPGLTASSAPTSAATSTPTATPASENWCNCDARSEGGVFEREGRCFRRDCIPAKQSNCSVKITHSFLVPGTWGEEKEVPCRDDSPQEPPAGRGGGRDGGSNLPPKPPAKATETPAPTETPEVCPGPEDENEFGLVGDGQEIGDCRDGDYEPTDHEEIPDEPGLCNWFGRHCAGGCWYSDRNLIYPEVGECP